VGLGVAQEVQLIDRGAQQVERKLVQRAKTPAGAPRLDVMQPSAQSECIQKRVHIDLASAGGLVSKVTVFLMYEVRFVVVLLVSW
jgi:hypothetical protein